MGEEREFAQEAAALCLACLSFSWTTGGVGAVVLPVIALLGIGRALWERCPERACAGVVATVIADMTRSGSVPPERIAAARRALATIPAGVTLPAADLAGDATDARGFATAVAARLLDALDPPPDPNTRSLIEIALTAAFQACRTRPEFRAALSESLLIRIAREQGVVVDILNDHSAMLRELLRRTDGFAGAMAQADGLTLAELQTLAAAFGETGLTDKAALTDFLRQKAQEYAAYRAQIDAIDTRTAGLGNLKAAAREAAERLDFAEVEMLLARVDTVETEIAAETKELRAANALLRGRAEEAFHHYTAAADSFAGIDRAEVARRRLMYGEPLCRHGLRYGGPGLALSARMIRAALDLLDEQRDAQDWADAQNNLAIALAIQGARTAGAEGAALLAEAVAAYRAALRVRTEAEHPVAWAATQNNLANTLQTQGTRTAGVTGAALLAEAAAAYRSALRVWTEEEHPVDWATIQNNLASALRTQGTRTAGADGAALLAGAVAACRAALRFRTETEHPVDWAMTQNNLANALATQGERAAGPEGAELLAEAVSAYHAALSVRTEAEEPVAWAATQNNLANTLRSRGERTAGAQGAALLAESVATYCAALHIWTEAEHPVDWAKTQENLALAEEALADHDTTADPRPHLEAALAHVEAALRVYDPDHLPFNHAKATDLRDDLLARLAALPPA